MFCPYCGKENPDETTFCIGCGKEIPASLRFLFQSVEKNQKPRGREEARPSKKE